MHPQMEKAQLVNLFGVRTVTWCRWIVWCNRSLTHQPSVTGDSDNAAPTLLRHLQASPGTFDPLQAPVSHA